MQRSIEYIGQNTSIIIKRRSLLVLMYSCKAQLVARCLNSQIIVSTKVSRYPDLTVLLCWFLMYYFAGVFIYFDLSQVLHFAYNHFTCFILTIYITPDDVNTRYNNVNNFVVSFSLQLQRLRENGTFCDAVFYCTLHFRCILNVGRYARRFWNGGDATPPSLLVEDSILIEGYSQNECNEWRNMIEAYSIRG